MFIALLGFYKFVVFIISSLSVGQKLNASRDVVYIIFAGQSYIRNIFRGKVRDKFDKFISNASRVVSTFGIYVECV